MLGPVASSSRSAMSGRPGVMARSSGAVRRFASSSRAMDRRITIRLAHKSSSFTVPFISSIFERLVAPFTSMLEQSPVPALAGAAGVVNDAEAATQTDVLDWDGMLNAVPKSKVSHSRKAMRSANKGLKDRVDFVHCQGCGRPRLAHHICSHCFSFIAREQKAAKRQIEASRAEHAKESSA